MVTLLVLLLFPLISSGRTSDLEERMAPPRLLILHPVDLRSNLVSKDLYLDIRDIFKTNEAWQTISLKEMEKKFIEYNIDPNEPCKELTCAFDAGGITQAQYTLYSSLTIFQNYYIFSLNLVNIFETKVVWSENGEIPIKTGSNPSEALLHRLHQIIKRLKPENINIRTAQPKGTLGILNLSPDSDYSKILFERLSTHAVTSGEYNLVDESEFDFILESLNIHPSSIVPETTNLILLGKKLGVDFLVYSRLKKKKNEFHLWLSLIDINKEEQIREWPSKSSDFRKLLKFEGKFFSNLTQQDFPEMPPTAKSKTPHWKWVAGPVSLMAAGVLGYLGWTEHINGNDKYEEWKERPQTSQQIERRPVLKKDVEQARLNRNIYGILGGIILSGSVVLVSF